MSNYNHLLYLYAKHLPLLFSAVIFHSGEKFWLADYGIKYAYVQKADLLFFTILTFPKTKVLTVNSARTFLYHVRESNP